MALRVLINGANRSPWIEGKSVQILGDLNEYVDTMTFKMKELPSRSNIPNLNDTVELRVNNKRIFGGHISRRHRSYAAKNYNVWEITAVDFTELLERQLVTEVYTNVKASVILQNMLTAAQQRITVSSNSFSRSDPLVSRISFNGLTTGQAITKLAKFIGRTWWCDENRVVHMPTKEDLPTVNLRDDGTGTAWIRKSFVARDDLSQVRNRVEVRGANIEGEQTTRTVTANGSDLYFHTVVPFSGTPAVSLNGVTQDVGIEYASLEEDHDVFHDSRTHTIRFKSAPANGARIVISGKVLVPIFYATEDDGSIGAYGKREYRITDATIRTTTAAIERADQEIDLYKNPPIEGSFRTYDINAVSTGSRININLPSMNVNTSGVITGVQIRWRDTEGEEPVATVSFYSTKHYGIIDYIAGIPEEDEQEIEFARQASIAKRFTQGLDGFGINDSNQVIAKRPPRVSSFPSSPSSGDRVELTQRQSVRTPFVPENAFNFNFAHLSRDNSGNLLSVDAPLIPDGDLDVVEHYNIGVEIGGLVTQRTRIAAIDRGRLVPPPILTGSPDGNYYLLQGLHLSGTTFRYGVVEYDVSRNQLGFTGYSSSRPNNEVNPLDMTVLSGGHMYILLSNGTIQYYNPTSRTWSTITTPTIGAGEKLAALSNNENGKLTAIVLGSGTMALYEYTTSWRQLEVISSTFSRLTGVAITGDRTLTTARPMEWSAVGLGGASPKVSVTTKGDRLFRSNRTNYAPGIYRYDGTKWV